MKYQNKFEEDFIWISAWILGNKLVKDKICDEEIEQKIFDGYGSLKNNKITEAFGSWLKSVHGNNF
ncbi:hypothetical protein [Halanaerobium hydrogeniformans]|uniref:hypothetical protein n=1 Tax=Halanaerobium hydrogeniformans TaxID=656519 RepID=UPI00135A170D|nr:hypothetical protein [Halanaerobium hydrogeniformans]